MKPTLSNAHGVAWLRQFARVDQPAAIRLVEELKFVDETEFAQSLKQYFLDLLKDEPSLFPMALYVEKEVPKTKKGVPKKLFAEPRRKFRRRVVGSAEPWIYRTVNKSGEVGSEGVLRTLVTELFRSNPKDFVSHSGPDILRAKKVNTFVVLSDFFGSGQRVRNLLTSAWLLRTFRSWYSGKQIRFMAVAYSGTSKGIANICAHPSKPDVRVVRACKTLESVTPAELSHELIELCYHYHDKTHKSFGALGYGAAGALLVFAHGCPNNAPSILHASMTNWTPLFFRRSIAGVVQLTSLPDIEAVSIGKLQNQEIYKLLRLPNAGQLNSLALRILHGVFAAISTANRSELAVSARCDLTVAEVRIVFGKLKELGWVTSEGRPTTEGLRYRDSYKRIVELENNRNVPPPPADDEVYYVPESLRRPRQI